MNVLITGVNGFIGTHYAHRARARGDTVIGLDLQPNDATGACTQYVELDLSAPQAAQTIRDIAPIEAIVHGGGVSGFMVQTDNPAGIIDTNILGTMVMLELARKRACRIVLCSTIMVYGPGDVGMPTLEETRYPTPTSVYGASKVANESLMLAYHAQFGVAGIALRLSHVYGPGRKTECFLRDMLAAAKTGQPCRIPQSALSPRQFVHIQDVCQALDLALADTAPGTGIFNISAGERHTLGEAAQVAARIAGAFEVEFDAQRRLPNYEVATLSILKAHQVLGYVPRLSLAQGLAHDACA